MTDAAAGIQIVDRSRAPQTVRSLKEDAGRTWSVEGGGGGGTWECMTDQLPTGPLLIGWNRTKKKKASRANF